MTRQLFALISVVVLLAGASAGCAPKPPEPVTPPPVSTPAPQPVPAPPSPPAQQEPQPQPEKIPLAELPIGSLVRDSSWQWEFRNGANYLDGATETKPIVWIIAARDHFEYEEPTPHVTLITAELIARYAFDDSKSRTRSPTPQGSNNWADSGRGDASFGLRMFLNSTYGDETHPHYGAGFYAALGEDFASNVLLTELHNVATHGIDGNVYTAPSFYTTWDYIFPLSHTEISGSLQSVYYEVGRTLAYFDLADAENGPADVTELQLRLDARILHTNRARYSIGYWTRQPTNIPDYDRNNYTLIVVASPNNIARTATNGVRPALNLRSSIMVSAKPDRNGVYEIVWDN